MRFTDLENGNNSPQKTVEVLASACLRADLTSVAEFTPEKMHSKNTAPTNQTTGNYNNASNTVIIRVQNSVSFGDRFITIVNPEYLEYCCLGCILCSIACIYSRNISTIRQNANKIRNNALPIAHFTSSQINVYDRFGKNKS